MKLHHIVFAFVVALAGLAIAGDTNFVGRVIVQDTDAAPTCSTASGAGMLCVEQAAELQSTLLVTGATTHTGATTFNGAVTLGAALSGGGDQSIAGFLSGTFADLTSNQTLTTAQCGAVLSTDDDNRTLTLPAVAAGNAGCVLTLTVDAANDQALVTLSPNASDGIYGTCCGLLDNATSKCYNFSGTDDADVLDAKAEQNKGDTISIVSNGADGWYTTNCTGLWNN